MNFRKLLFVIGALGMLLASCAKVSEIENLDESTGLPREITATFNATRTSVDDSWNTMWDKNDMITVYVTRTSGWDNIYGYSVFTYNDEGKFVGNINDKSTDPANWFAVYPSFQSSSSTSSKVSAKIEHPAIQTMNGNSKDHIAGTNDPLFGYALNVAKGTNPTITMHHIASVIDFHITNGSENAIKVTKVEFTAPVKIAGEFTADVNLWDDEVENPEWTAGSSALNTVTLNVSDGVEIAKDGNSDFYAAIHPISASGNYTIKVTATSGGKTYVAEKTVNANFTFKAGKYKTVNFTFVPGEPEPEKTYTKTTNSTAGGYWEGTYLIVDENAKVAFAYDKSGNGYKTNVSISNNKIVSRELEKYEVTITANSGYNTHYDIKTSDGNYLYYTGSGSILHDSNKSGSYTYYAKIGEKGNISLGTKYSGWNVTEYYFRYNSTSGFDFGGSSSSTIQLYKLDGETDPDTPDTPDTPTPSGAVFNLENDYLKAYLDAAEKQYTNNTTSSIVDQYIGSSSGGNSWYGGGGVANDLPKPVTLTWTGSATSISIFEGTSASGTAVKTMTFNSSSSVDIYNLIPGKTYSYKTSNNQTGTFSTTGRRRMIKVSDTKSENHARNCRDLGGIQTRDGKTLKYGLIYRGTNVDDVSDSEKGILHDELGIRLDQDLRNETKKTSSPIGSDVEFCHHGGYDANTITSQDGDNMKQSVLHVLNAVIEGRPVYFHCRIGSDRTGHMGMLYLALLGCDLKECDIDYEITSFASKMTYGTRTIGSGNEASFRSKFIMSPYNNDSVPEAVEAYVTGTLNIPLDTVKKFRKAMGVSETL